MSIPNSQGSGQPTTLPIDIERQARHDYWVHRCRVETRRRLYQPAPPLPPEAQAAIRAYWGSLFKEEIAALDAEWAAPRTTTPITSDTKPESVNDSFPSISKSA